jgi:flagellar secretion chaperone FliS
MNGRDSASAYYKSTACGATAVGQVIALYDTILRDLHSCLEAIEAGNVEKRVNSSNHALIVIGELQGVLDFEHGGEAARHLNSFYNVARGMTTQASVMSSREKFQELIAMFARIRAAWSQVEQKIAPSEPLDRPRVPAKAQPAFSKKAAVPAESSEGSGNGRWSA